MFLSVSLMAMTSKNTIQVQPVKYVMTYKDFRLHTEVHIANVRRLGMALYEKYKDSEFKNVPRELLFMKLGLHDYEKLASVKELRKWGYHSERSLGERLYDYYGQDKESQNLSPAQKEYFQDLIDEVNEYAVKIDLEFYQKYGLNPEIPEFNDIIEKMNLIARVSDLVERENNPVSPEEFHREKMLPAEDFLASNDEKEMARFLSNGYVGAVQSNPLEARLREITRVDMKVGGSCRGMYVN